MRITNCLIPFLVLTALISANCSKHESGERTGGEENIDDGMTDIAIDGAKDDAADKAAADKLAADKAAADKAAQALSEKGQFPEIVSSIFGGNGCPATDQPVKAVMDNATGRLTLEYPNFTAIAADATLFRAFCRYSLSINVPQNKQLVVQHEAAATFNVEASLPIDGGTINGNYYFNSGFEDIASFTEIAVPAGNNQKSSLPIKANAVKSGCGTSELLHFSATAQVPKGTGTLTIKSAGPFLFKLVACP